MAGWVLGCHRSGTSLLCGLLRSATGLSHRDLLGGDIPDSVANPVGHHESAALLQVNERLLQACGSSWDHPFAEQPNWRQPDLCSLFEQCRPTLRRHRQHQLWIDKDPRLCLTRPAVEAILERRLPAIAILRHPLAVARSLQQRDGFSLEQSARIWLLYNHHLFNSPCQAPSAVLLFDQLLEGGVQMLETLQHFLQEVHQEGGNPSPLAWPEDPQQLWAGKRKPELVRSPASWTANSRQEGRLVRRLNRLWDQVEHHAQSNNLPALTNLFNKKTHHLAQGWWYRLFG